jgi:tRNA modification GTPase
MINESKIVQKEPIAAIATPVGEGGIAVIRVSGKDAIAKVNEAFRGSDLTQQDSHTVHLGKIVNKQDNVVDEVLVTLFHAPKSYTGEESVEVSCHGGVLVTQAVLEVVLALGIRSAEPGEFTQRAFLNGKLKLSQAEAVGDLIHAKSSKALDSAHQQLEGRLGEHIQQFRQQIIDATAMVELELDFAEEDVKFADKGQLRKLLIDLDEEIGKLLATYETGRLVKDGIRTVFIGLPNAGKSTLMNTLIGKDRAIVTEVAGTTRDTVDVDWSYDGLRFRLTDTAGLREAADIVEAEGVKRSQKAFEEADLAVYLKDLSNSLQSKERDDIRMLQNKARETPFLLIGSKNDIAAETMDESAGMRTGSLDYDLKISALKDDNIDVLKKLMKQRALENTHYDTSSLLVTSSRHRDALQKAKQNVQSAIAALDQGMTGDFLSIDLRAALNELGMITGEITNETILDSIFSRFCIGK